MFVTAQPHSRLKFARAIKSAPRVLCRRSRSVLEHAVLEDALQIVGLYGDTAACRHYLARWLLEKSPSLEDIGATACSFVERRQREGS